jgi:peroxiredoxin
MLMKNAIKILCTSFIIFLFIACNSRPKGSFTIKGNLVLPENTDISLFYLGVEKASIVDSVTLRAEKEFLLEAATQQTGLFSLRIKGLDDIFLVIKPGDEIILDIDNSIAHRAYTVQGSPDSRLVNELMTQNQRVRDQITDLSIDYENSKNTPQTYELQKVKFDSIYDRLLETHRNFTIDFIKRNYRSPACIFALYQDFGKQKSQPLFNTYDDIEIFNFVDSNLTILFPTTEAVIALNRDVTEIKEQIKYKKYSESIIQPGKKSPPFELVTIENKRISLSDYSGKVVVFYFFALWNKESVQEAIELNKLVTTYAYRNVNIVGVSFDTSPEKLQAFIAENKISFPVACDYHYWQSDYVEQFGVRMVPDILLLDKNHIINKRNINTQELIQILSEWKKNNLL